MKQNISQKKQSSLHYFSIWRWHFYAGILVTPGLILLAATGLAMIIFAQTVGRLGEQITIPVQTTTKTLQEQALAAQMAVDSTNGKVVQYIAPTADNMVAMFRVDTGNGDAMMAAVNPYTAEVVDISPRFQGWYQFAENLHSDMMIGTFGDFLLEASASLTIILILTGFYLWWNKQKSIPKMLFPQWKKQTFWRSLHAMLGSWVSLLLLTFCLSGLAWSGIWGEKMVQAWSQFPAGKWGNPPIPVSTLPVHGDLNASPTSKEVPWVLEKTPMPVSGTSWGEKGIDLTKGEHITLDKIESFARKIGFEGRYQVNFPKGETGVWTLSQDSMSYDSPSPTADRTVHIDQYSGHLLADIRYDDYNWFGKFMAVSIALHMGTMGWWSIIMNILFCLAIIIMCISGWVIWWKRRPTNAVGLVPPAQKNDLPIWYAAAIPLLLIALIFPAAILVIAPIWLLDKLLISHNQTLQKWFK
ncbi:PepSY domain-containing protein [Pelistega sp. NLN82]|uniref:PepSY domain-containing protein n=1 Tax=Pelistega ratti TaxID=2652177 RepID=A0A6L9Y3G7_9BURK|nr:PepSY domain-containing protein [Pelistega ratti]NEN74766.1 PepSY domain-containing protein [Pelistega ratti]